MKSFASLELFSQQAPEINKVFLQKEYNSNNSILNFELFSAQVFEIIKENL